MSSLDRDRLRTRVQRALDDFISARRPLLDAIGPELSPIADALEELVAGGKRMRPQFCVWGHLGAGGDDSDDLIVAAAALELFQACALVHDDVMDASETRRGKPATHRAFAALHRANGWSGEPDAFGAGAAILLGDLCLAWADEMLASSRLTTRAALRVYGDMHVDVVAGQYLDLLEQAKGGGTVESALRVARFKAAKYTVERPLHLGAALAGAGPDVLATYTAYGVPLGEAFQLRDDLLGVFGDPSVTGKPAGGDLREGKRTALVAFALAAAREDQAAVVRRYLGDPHLDAAGVAALQDVLRETRAVDQVEALIATRTAAAVAALDDAPITPDAKAALRDLAVAATTRAL